MAGTESTESGRKQIGVRVQFLRVVFNGSDQVLVRRPFIRMVAMKVSLQLSSGMVPRSKARLVLSGAPLRSPTGMFTLLTLGLCGHGRRDRLVLESKRDTKEAVRGRAVGGWVPKAVLEGNFRHPNPNIGFSLFWEASWERCELVFVHPLWSW